WPSWFEAAGVAAPTIRGPVFDSSLTMVEAALQGEGVALAPPMMFSRQLAAGALMRPFDTSISMGRYWLTRLKSRSPTPAMGAFRIWLLEAAARNSTE
ncbi:LysR substrate-binding domain-containing protein, partial [Rhizobiaceae sp. 2RAB30]